VRVVVVVFNDNAGGGDVVVLMVGCLVEFVKGFRNLENIPKTLFVFVMHLILAKASQSLHPTKTFHLFLLLSLKHAQNPLLVFLEPCSLPKQILLFSWLFCFVLIPTARIIFDALSH
jgi:hypothetical protein